MTVYSLTALDGLAWASIPAAYAAVSWVFLSRVRRFSRSHAGAVRRRSLKCAAVAAATGAASLALLPWAGLHLPGLPPLLLLGYFVPATSRANARAVQWYWWHPETWDRRRSPAMAG
jgi:hypothetical protein